MFSFVLDEFWLIVEDIGFCGLIYVYFLYEVGVVGVCVFLNMFFVSGVIGLVM